MLAPKSPDKTNRVLPSVLLGIAVVAIVLLSLYLYKLYGGGKVGISQDTSGQNMPIQGNDSLVGSSAPVIFTSALPAATVDEQYQATVYAGVYNRNLQITGKAISDLPAELKLTCSTEYNSRQIPKEFAAKNSLSTCVIDGIPRKSGEFVIRITFSIPESTSKVYRDFLLVVNPTP